MCSICLAAKLSGAARTGIRGRFRYRRCGGSDQCWLRRWKFVSWMAACEERGGIDHGTKGWAGTEGRTLTHAQAKRLLKELEAIAWVVLFIVMLATGFRRGEALGLRWDDVDLRKRSVGSVASCAESGATRHAGGQRQEVGQVGLPARPVVQTC